MRRGASRSKDRGCYAREWELVLESDIWNSHDVLQGILPALLLSYHDLPPALKQCFAYFSIFPKDWGIEKDMIVKLWVAQGFICSERSRDMEEIGGLYFDDLLRPSLLQDAELDRDKNIFRCKMHDLVHDLVQSVAGSDCSLMEIIKQSPSNLNDDHHSFLIVSDKAVNEADRVTSISATLHMAHKLQTLLLRNDSRISGVPPNLFDHLRCLRALDLSGSKMKELPRTVGELKHLRYLNLSHTYIAELPEEVTDCGNLQTLRLDQCTRLKKLPRRMGKMISLRHLELDSCLSLSFIPQGIGRLTSLRTLKRFIVGGGNEGCKWGELKHLNHLQGRLRIIDSEKVRSRDEAREAELYKKQHLHKLILIYKYESNELLDDEVKRMEDVLEILQPHTNLKELEIWYYKGSKLPKWIQDPVFSNLVKVKLLFCDKCKQLPGLGKLPSLKYLEIRGTKEVRKVGGEFCGDDNNDRRGGGGVSFPKLETLFFEDMPNWEEWELRGGDGEVMPSLLLLQISECRKLKELPSNLPPLLQKLSLSIGNDGLPSGGPLPVLPNLKHSVIWNCPELTLFPCGWLGHLKALQTLEIEKCQRLGSVPEELQLLTMLQHLKIESCPLLKECYRVGGEDRHKIAHISNISILP